MGTASILFCRAWEELQTESGNVNFGTPMGTLIVTGKVQALGAPTLEEEQPPSNQPNTLSLTFSESEVNASYKHVWFQKEVKRGAYNEVKLSDQNGDLMGILKIGK